MIFAFYPNGAGGLGFQSITIECNLALKTWKLTSDPGGGWAAKVGYTSQGRLETSNPNAFQIWDTYPGGGERNIAIIQGPPQSESDTTRTGARVRLYDPKTTSLKDVMLTWTVQLQTAPAAPPPPPAVQSSLSASRDRILKTILPEVLPCAYPEGHVFSLVGEKPNQKENWEPKVPSDSDFGRYVKNPYNPRKKGAGTSCYSLPAWVAFQLGRQFRFPGTTGMPNEGRRYKAWVDGKPGLRPKPGDLYALCAAGSTGDKAITHVGVMIDSSGATWTTADTGGNPGGYGGKFGARRKFDEATYSLEGEVHDGFGQRPLYGWIDIDLLVGG